MFEHGPEALWETMEEAADAYAEGAAEELVPAVEKVIATWRPLPLPADAEVKRARLLALPGLGSVIPALTAIGIDEAYDEICESAGGDEWQASLDADGYLKLTLPNGEPAVAPSSDEVAKGVRMGHLGIAEGCASALVRALVASIDEEGYLTGTLDDAMVPRSADARSAFNTYLSVGDGDALEREFVLQVLRETKRTLPAGQELPKALAGGFPRRPPE